MKLLIIDNYDSFTYNLVHLIEGITGIEVAVHPNDAIACSEVDKYDHIVLSPGPGLPGEAGITLSVIKEFAPVKKILGVCLGHQALGVAFGAAITNLSSVYHGVATPLYITQQHALWDGIVPHTPVGRYHSWVVEGAEASFTILAEDEDRNNMAMVHHQFNCIGVQFHPESILTPSGRQMIENWLYKC